MDYNSYHFVGMHVFWWFIWGILLFWIFATPYDIPGQRRRKDTALEILKQRYAKGQIEKEEYLAKKTFLEGKES
jgi:putative membrane protein